MPATPTTPFEVLTTDPGRLVPTAGPGRLLVVAGWEHPGSEPWFDTAATLAATAAQTGLRPLLIVDGQVTNPPPELRGRGHVVTAAATSALVRAAAAGVEVPADSDAAADLLDQVVQVGRVDVLPDVDEPETCPLFERVEHHRTRALVAQLARQRGRFVVWARRLDAGEPVLPAGVTADLQLAVVTTGAEGELAAGTVEAAGKLAVMTLAGAAAPTNLPCLHRAASTSLSPQECAVLLWRVLRMVALVPAVARSGPAGAGWHWAWDGPFLDLTHESGRSVLLPVGNLDLDWEAASVAVADRTVLAGDPQHLFAAPLPRHGETAAFTELDGPVGAPHPTPELPEPGLVSLDRGEGDLLLARVSGAALLAGGDVTQVVGRHPRT